jgi:hypothetical protein
MEPVKADRRLAAIGQEQIGFLKEHRKDPDSGNNHDGDKTHHDPYCLHPVMWRIFIHFRFLNCLAV